MKPRFFKVIALWEMKNTKFFLIFAIYDLHFLTVFCCFFLQVSVINMRHWNDTWEANVIATIIIEKKGGEKASRECPNCHSKLKVKNGFRDLNQGRIQRFLCKICGHRFSEASSLSRISSNNNGCQVCVSSQRSKNLTEINPQKIGLAGATAKPDVLGKIVQYTESSTVENFIPHA